MVQKKLKEKTLRIFQILRETYPEAKIALNFSNPMELLVATILSAQCTDVRVNLVTPELFKKYQNVQDFAAADLSELENDIRSTGFYKNKAKNIKMAAAMIAKDYQGRVPDSMAELTKLPGVGRKTANVILGNAYNAPGIVVDTHVIRLSNRIGLVKEKDPVKIEFALNKLLPEDKWTLFSHLLIAHGRGICNARKPRCGECPIFSACAYPKNEAWILLIAEYPGFK